MSPNCCVGGNAPKPPAYLNQSSIRCNASRVSTPTARCALTAFAIYPITSGSGRMALISATLLIKALIGLLTAAEELTSKPLDAFKVSLYSRK